jgi:nicotinamidase-related amidase
MPESTAKRPWTDFVTERDVEVYATSGFGAQVGLGERPGLLIIDAQYRTTGESRVPIQQAMEEYATACGEDAWRAVDRIEVLLGRFREQRWPVMYAQGERANVTEGARYTDKIPSLAADYNLPGSRGATIVEPLTPRPGELIIYKRFPSIFFGTNLITQLVNHAVDTLVVVGCTTSGCVRATVVDGMSFGFRCVVPEDCVWDRGEASHAINLFDISQKYADVLPLDELLPRLEPLAPGREPPHGAAK